MHIAFIYARKPKIVYCRKHYSRLRTNHGIRVDHVIFTKLCHTINNVLCNSLGRGLGQ